MTLRQAATMEEAVLPAEPPEVQGLRTGGLQRMSGITLGPAASTLQGATRLGSTVLGKAADAGRQAAETGRQVATTLAPQTTARATANAEAVAGSTAAQTAVAAASRTQEALARTQTQAAEAVSIVIADPRGAATATAQTAAATAARTRETLARTQTKASEAVGVVMADPKGAVAAAAATTAVAVGKVAMKGATAAAVGATQVAERAGIDVKQTKERAKARFLEMTGDIRKSIMATLKGIIKEGAVADADMWSCVKRATWAAIDTFWSDVEYELERQIEIAVLTQDTEEEEGAAPSCGRLCCCLAHVRAFTLHHFLPHDRSVFGKMKDPVWWVFTITSAITIFGVRPLFLTIVLLMLCMPGPPDEYQLTQFIVMLKGSQFFTIGFLQTLVACWSYYYCATWRTGSLQRCVREYGPGSGDFMIFAVADYLMNCLLCWIAFWTLPYCVQHHARKFMVTPKRKPEGDTVQHAGSATSLAGKDGAASDDDDEKAQRGRCCGGRRRDHTRGGRLRTLFYYDIIVFMVVLGGAVLLTILSGFDVGRGVGRGAKREGVWNDPQIKANIFLARITYSLFMFPFAVFSIPVLSTVLTHCDPTGFNRRGLCVIFQLRGPPDVQRSEAGARSAAAGAGEGAGADVEVGRPGAVRRPSAATVISE